MPAFGQIFAYNTRARTHTRAEISYCFHYAYLKLNTLLTTKYYNLPSLVDLCLHVSWKTPFTFQAPRAIERTPATEKEIDKKKKPGILASKPHRARTFNHQSRSAVDFNI